LVLLSTAVASRPASRFGSLASDASVQVTVLLAM
jgi:hypothetical protein